MHHGEGDSTCESPVLSGPVKAVSYNALQMQTGSLSVGYSLLVSSQATFSRGGSGGKMNIYSSCTSPVSPLIAAEGVHVVLSALRLVLVIKQQVSLMLVLVVKLAVVFPFI